MYPGALLVLALTACSLTLCQGQDYGGSATNLWLSLDALTNDTAALTLHQTSSSRVYELLSASDLAAPWQSEGMMMGEDTQTLAGIALNERTNQLFFCARAFPGNGQVLVTRAAKAPLMGYINEESEHVSPFFLDTYLLSPPLYSINLGYDAGDDGPPDIPLVDQQDVTSLEGFGPEMSLLTNLCLSHNPLTSLDLHGLPALQDVECFQCPNLAWVSLSNCPSLTRACIEQCYVQGTLDFTGDFNLADIRAADNAYTNIVFGGIGSNVWHLCVHDNTTLQSELPLSNFPVLRELLAWSANQHGVLAPTSPQLYYLESEANYYESAELSNLPQLQFAFLNGNSLTNLTFNGATNLGYLSVSGNQLGSAALDYVLTNMDGLGESYGYLDVSANAALPSPVGYQAVTNLIDKGWEVYVDY